MQTRTALLLGASGLVGGQLLHLLLNEDEYRVLNVLVRAPLPFDHPKLHQTVVDFDHLDRYKESITGDDVFSCLGTTIRKAGSQEAFRRVDFSYVVQAAALASGNGAEQFLLISSLGADRHSRIFYNRVKGEVEEAVGKLPFKAIQIFRPSLLLGERIESRPGELAGAIFMKLFSFLLVGSLRRYRGIPARKVAAGMVLAAKRRAPGVNIFESDHIQSLT